MKKNKLSVSGCLVTLSHQTTVTLIVTIKFISCSVQVQGISSGICKQTGMYLGTTLSTLTNTLQQFAKKVLLS